MQGQKRKYHERQTRDREDMEGTYKHQTPHGPRNKSEPPSFEEVKNPLKQ